PSVDEETRMDSKDRSVPSESDDFNALIMLLEIQAKFHHYTSQLAQPFAPLRIAPVSTASVFLTQTPLRSLPSLISMNLRHGSQEVGRSLTSLSADWLECTAHTVNDEKTMAVASVAFAL
ncbi:hypothetical protein BS47DRAFT_1354314, partial [Hydnum rufescens UP504]